MRRHPGRSLAAAAALVAAAAVPLGLVGAAAPARAAAPAKDVTANLFMWNWTSVAAECANILGPDGYAAVQVAPPEDSMTDAADGHPWWEIYQPVDYNLTSRMGNDAQFRAMVTACHTAGVKVYVDAVLNHMARQDGNDTSYGGVSYTPGSSYPAYSSADFHNYPGDCPVSSDQITDWNDYQQVTECELDTLPDLRTESTYVRTTVAAYLNKLIGYGVDGFRLDAAKHIGHTDLAALEALLNKDTTTGQPVYIVQEVALGSTNTQLQPTSFESTGSLIGFDYADALKTQFSSGGDLANFGGFSSWSLIPSAYSSTFVNNHDTERDGSNLSYKSGAVYALATEFLLACGFGTPQVYSSFTWTTSDQSPPSDANGYVTAANCSSGWYCTDRLTGVANMVGWHNLALTNGDAVANWYTDGTNLIAFSRGPDAWISLNNESSAQTRTFTTGLPDGTYCDLIHGSVVSGACTGSTVTVSGNRATVTVPADDAVAIDRNSRVSGSSASTFTVNVNANVTTNYGQNVYIVGSIPALGSWNTANAVALSSQNYPYWTAALSVPTGTYFEYKYIKIDSSGTVTWESGSNRSYTTGSSGSITFNDTWHS